jgi:hypothetical protein
MDTDFKPMHGLLPQAGPPGQNLRIAKNRDVNVMVED